MSGNTLLFILLHIASAHEVRECESNSFASTAPTRALLQTNKSKQIVEHLREDAFGGQHVDVFIGTAGHGHTFPGAAVPWGMVQATPWCHKSNNPDWDAVAGYTSGPKLMRFYGMAHSALSGSGSGELGELRLLPIASAHAHDHNVQIWLHTATAKGSPGFFAAHVGSDEYQPDVQIESTATARGALHRFAFNQTGEHFVSLFLSEPPNSYWGFSLKDSKLEIVSDRRVEGCSSGAVTGIGDAAALLCFVLEFDNAFKDPKPGVINGPDITLEFAMRDSKVLIASVAVSRTDLPHARVAFTKELRGSSFDQIHRQAQRSWDDALNVIEADLQHSGQKMIFYTALYHSLLFPSLYSDEDGSYRSDSPAANNKSSTPRHNRGKKRFHDLDKEEPVSVAVGHNQYATFSLWDTYRSLHPLVNIFYPRHASAFGNSLMGFAESWNDLPPFQLLASSGDMMEGDGGSIILSTMARQGLIDKKDAFTILKQVRRFLRAGEGETHAVSQSLVQAMADECVSRVAQDLGRMDDMEFFHSRANTVFSHWNSSSKLFGAKSREANSDNPRFIEGTPLQYSFATSFDIKRLAELHGGAEQLACKLDYFFQEAPVPSTRKIDVSGSQHGMSIGNEPSMHIPYLYSLIGFPSRTQDTVDELVKRFFSDAPNGLPGNDDLGQMSSWLVFSMLGFYPVDPCSGEYVLGRPFVKSAKLNLANAYVQLTVHNQSYENKYIQRVRWQDKDLDMQRLVISHKDLLKGGALEIWMTPEYMGSEPRCDSTRA